MAREVVFAVRPVDVDGGAMARTNPIQEPLHRTLEGAIAVIPKWAHRYKRESRYHLCDYGYFVIDEIPLED